LASIGSIGGATAMLEGLSGFTVAMANQQLAPFLSAYPVRRRTNHLIYLRYAASGVIIETEMCLTIGRWVAARGSRVDASSTWVLSTLYCQVPPNKALQPTQLSFAPFQKAVQLSLNVRWRVGRAMPRLE
jgi:hypothetical protein